MCVIQNRSLAVRDITFYCFRLRLANSNRDRLLTGIRLIRHRDLIDEIADSDAHVAIGKAREGHRRHIAGIAHIQLDDAILAVFRGIASQIAVFFDRLRSIRRHNKALLLRFCQHHDRGEMRSREGQEAVLDIIVLAVVDTAVFIHDTGSDRAAGPVAVQRDLDRCRAGIAAVFRCQFDVPSTGDLLAIQFRALIDRSHSDARQAGSRDRNTGRFVRNRLVIIDFRQRRAEGRNGIRRLADHGSFRLRAGVVRPDAEHRARRIVDRAAREGLDIEVLCLRCAALCISLAEHPVVGAVCVDHLEALACKIRCRHRSIAVPAIRPIADHDIGIERAAGSIVCKIDAIIERHRGHAGILDQRGNRIDILHIIAVLAGVLQLAKAHRTAVVLVVRILVRAHVEILAALTCKVRNILLQQFLRKGNGRVVRNINRANRTIVGAVRPRQARSGREDRIHMARRIEHRDDAHALFLGIGKDGVHLGLGQLVDSEVIIGLVARVDRRLHGITLVGRAVHGQAHIVQQEAHTVVADAQHDIAEACRGSIVDDLLDAVHGKILSAAVEHDDGKLIIRLYSVIRLRLSRLHSLGRLLCGRFLSRRRENDERCEHRRDQQQREERFAQFSHQYFLLFLG